MADPAEIEKARRQSIYWQAERTTSTGPGRPPTLRRVVEIKGEQLVESGRMLDLARARLKAAKLSGAWLGVAEDDHRRAYAEHEMAKKDLDWWRRELRRCPDDADKEIWVPNYIGRVLIAPTAREPGEEG